jgi:hypothetical protein
MGRGWGGGLDEAPAPKQAGDRCGTGEGAGKGGCEGVSEKGLGRQHELKRRGRAGRHAGSVQTPCARRRHGPRKRSLTLGSRQGRRLWRDCHWRAKSLGTGRD